MNGVVFLIWKCYHVTTLGPSDKYQSLELVQTREEFVFHPMIGLWKRSQDWQPHWRNLGLRRGFWANQSQDRNRAEHQSWLITSPGCPPPPVSSRALETPARSPPGWRGAAWRGARAGSVRAGPVAVSAEGRRSCCQSRPGWGTEARAAGWSEGGRIERTGWHHCAAWSPSAQAESSHRSLCTADFGLHKPAECCWDCWKTGNHRDSPSRGQFSSFLVWREENKSGWFRSELRWRKSASAGWPSRLGSRSEAETPRPPRPGTWSGSWCSCCLASSSWAGSPAAASPGWWCLCSCNTRGQYPRIHPCPALVFHGELLRSTCWGRDCDEWNSTWNKTRIILVNYFVIFLLFHFLDMENNIFNLVLITIKERVYFLQ